MYEMMPSLQVKDMDYRITAVCAAAHVHHRPDFGVNPLALDPKMTQADLNSIASIGLYGHILNGGHVPNKEAVRAVQQVWGTTRKYRL